MSLICKLFRHKFVEIRQKETLIEGGTEIQDVRYLHCSRCRKLFKQYAETSGYYERTIELNTDEILHAMVIQNDIELTNEMRMDEIEAALKYLRG